MSTSRSEACLPPNPQLFLISSSYLPASLVIVHSKTTVWEGFKENNQLVAYRRLFKKQCGSLRLSDIGIREPDLGLKILLSLNRLVWTKSLKMGPNGAWSRCAPFDQWSASAGQDCLMICWNYQSTWKRWKKKVSREIISTSRVIWSVWVTTKQIFMQFVHKICLTRFLQERRQESSPANEMKFRLMLISFYIWGQKYNIIILAKLSVVGGGGATTDG